MGTTAFKHRPAMQIQMHPTARRPGWGMRLAEQGVRFGCHPAPQGQLHCIIKDDSAVLLLAQDLNVARTTVVHNPSSSQRRLAAKLVASGIATFA